MKCEIYWPSGDPNFPEFPPEIRRPKDGITLLVWGSTDFIATQVNDVINKAVEMQDKILDLDDPQVEMHLLRSCLGACKVNHLLRTVPKCNLTDQIHHFDKSLRSSLGRIIHSTIPDASWEQASLPFRLGGLSIRKTMDSADAAYVASCNAARLSLPATLLIDHPLIGEREPLTVIPGEDEARSNIAPFVSSETTTLEDPSQSNLQASLDQCHFNTLREGLSIRDKVRLQTLAESSHTSAWLKAVPLESLGLSIPSPSFVVSVKIWLGIPMFPVHPLLKCSCGAMIDPYGDHLLGCGQGPLRIRRHNGLRDVIWHALLQDDTEVRRELRISGDSQERPGDIAHPTFVDGRPTYFDVSVSNTLQPGNLNRALSMAGVAALEAEMRKDTKYEDHVRSQGGRFIPLVVESLGLWSPFATSMLHSIAERTTLKNGLRSATAFANFIKQLSVVLWTFNAKMVLSYLDVLPDPLWDLPA